MAGAHAPTTVRDYCSVAVLGAGPGAVIRGIADNAEGKITTGKDDTREPQRCVKGVQLRVVSGFVAPLRSRIDAIPADFAWNRELATLLKITPPQAELLRRAVEPHATSPPEADSEEGGGDREPWSMLGCTSKCVSKTKPHAEVSTAQFVIESVGSAWTHEALVEAQRKGTWLHGNELAAMLKEAHLENAKHPGNLCLRPYHWMHHVGGTRLTESEVAALGPDGVDLDRCGDLVARSPAGRGGAPDHVYRITRDEHVFTVRAPAPAPTELTLEQVKAHLLNPAGIYVGAAYQNLAPSDIERAWAVLTHPRCKQALYKSMLQKIIRGFVSKIALPDDDPAPVAAAAVLAVVFGVCFTTRGGAFNTDLAKYIRGQTAILKRAAVSIIEDGGNLSAVPWYMGVALVTSEVVGYHCSLRTLDEAFLAAFSPSAWAHGVVRWRPEWSLKYERAAPRGRRSVDVRPSAISHCERLARGFLKAADAIRHVLRSLPQDYDMCDEVARLMQLEAVPMLTFEADVRQPLLEYVMPFHHCLDQHVARGVGFCCARMRADDVVARNPTAPFRPRHRQVFDEVSGYNPRITGAVLNTSGSAAIREGQTAQRILCAEMFRLPIGTASLHPLGPDLGVDTLRLRLHQSVLAGGVGDVPLAVFATTPADNLKNGLSPDEAGFTRWDLVACIGATSDTVHATHKPTAHLGVNEKKPRLTPQVLKEAEKRLKALSETKALPFKSALLPEYTHAKWNGEHWVLFGKSAQPLVWDYCTARNAETTLPILPMPKFFWNRTAEVLVREDQDDRCLEQCASYCGPAGICAGREASKLKITELVVTGLETAELRERLAHVVTTAHSEVRLSTPNLNGGFQSDQPDCPMHGDWYVWRVLALVARLVPAALEPRVVPCFRVRDAVAWRVVVGWILAAVESARARPATAAAAAATAPLGGLADSLEALKAKMAADGAELTDYQADLMEAMLARDQGPAQLQTKAHFVALDVGMGKTLLAIRYLLEYAALNPGAKRVLWFTDSAKATAMDGVVRQHYDEFKTKWGLPHVHFVRTESELNTKMHLPGVFVMSYATLSNANEEEREAFAALLASLAPSSLLCLDETHKLYNPGVIRNGHCLRIMRASMRSVFLSASPASSKAQKLAVHFLQAATPFEVTDANTMAAFSMMLSSRKTLGIKVIEHTQPVEVPVEVRTRSLDLIRSGGKWLDAERVVREACLPKMAEQSAKIAAFDRERHPDGGAFVVVRNRAHGVALAAQIEAANPGIKVGWQGEDGAGEDASVSIVLQQISRAHGYNLPRLGMMLIMPYPSSHATRYQIRGRLTRLTQKRKTVEVVNLVPTDTVLGHLHKRQCRMDAKAESLEQVCKDWVKEADANPGGKRKRAA